jgi:fluoride ion exporter CrcB/FEX
MSTFAVEGDLLLKDGHAAAAFLYVVATVVVGVAAMWIGVAMARAFDPARAR